MSVMRSAFSLISTIGFFLFTVSAALGAPRAAVERSTFDFGKVAQGKNVEHVFIIKNSGDAPLTIGRVSTSCGCTVADVSSRTIAPGKKAEISATFNSTNFSGNVSKNILVQTNDPKVPVHTLTMKGTVLEEIQVIPKQINLGELQAGTRKDTTVTIENRGKQPLTLASAKSTIPQVTVKPVKSKVRPGGKAVIQITVAPRKEDRFLGGYVTVKTDNPAKPEITIPVYASVAK